MNSLHSAATFWLVEHPSISQFEWIQGQTLGSTPFFLTITVLTYLSLTFSLHFYLSTHSPISPSLLRLISIIHNLILTLLSLIMTVGCSLSILSQMSNSRWIFCFPPNHTPPRGPVFFWANVFYFSKILEFLDTLLIILAGGGRRLSFLHIYHHAVVVVMCYVWLATAQSLFPVALVTNAAVHVVMYYYYLLCAVGKRPWWKRAVTDLQILQFVFSFVMSGFMLYYHFSGIGCCGVWGWCFNAVFNASLLALFFNFHSKNYDKKKKKGKGEVKDKGL